ncbi:hypothetical protein Tco_0579299, partial [Tanacetum coccineum]
MSGGVIRMYRSRAVIERVVVGRLLDVGFVGREGEEVEEIGNVDGWIDGYLKGGGAGVQDAGVHVVNEESGDAAVADQIEESDHVVQDEWANIVRVKDEMLATITDRTKGSKKKRKAAGGASGSNLPPKKLRADYDTSGAGVSTDGKKSVFALQGLLQLSTCLFEVGVAAGGYVAVNSNVADAKVSFVDRSLALDPHILTTVIATMVVVVVSSVSVPRVGNELVRASIFADSTSVGTDMDSEMLRQIYVDKWNVLNESALDNPNMCRSLVDHLACLVFFSQLCGMDYDHLFTEFNVGAAHQTCLGAEVKMRLEHVLKEKKKLEGRYARQADLLKERDAKIRNLKAQ